MNAKVKKERVKNKRKKERISGRLKIERMNGRKSEKVKEKERKC